MNEDATPVPASQVGQPDDPANPVRNTNTGWFDVLQSRTKPPPRADGPDPRHAWYLPLQKERYGQKATAPPSNIDADITMRSPRQVREHSISGPSNRIRKVRNEDENATDGDMEDNSGEAEADGNELEGEDPEQVRFLQSRKRHWETNLFFSRITLEGGVLDLISRQIQALTISGLLTTM